MQGIAPGLDGLLAARRQASGEQSQQLGQVQGLLGIQQAMAKNQQMQKDQQLKGLLGQAIQSGDQGQIQNILSQIDPMGMAKGMMPKPPKWTATEIMKPDGTKDKGFVDINSPNPESTFRSMGVEPVKREVVNGLMINPYTRTAPVPNVNQPFNLDDKGVAVPNLPYQNYQRDKARLGASNVSTKVVLPEGDDEYIKQRRKGQATAFTDLEKAGQSAYNQYNTLDRFIKASEKGFAGGAAPMFAGTANLLSSFGMNIAPEALKDTRIMEQAIGDILGNKMAELGARGLTDKDMEILRQNLPRVETDKGSRVAVAGVLKKASAATLREYENARSEEAKNFPELSARSPTPAWFKDYQASKAKFQPSGGGNAPAGVDPKVWSHMTPEERALWP